MPTNIVVPEVGESIVDARVAKWLRQEGDAVSAGDPLVELETDKIDLEVSATTAGVIARIDRNAGDDVKVGEVLGVIEEGEAPAKREEPAAAEPAAAPASAAGKAPVGAALAAAPEQRAEAPLAAAPEQRAEAPLVAAPEQRVGAALAAAPDRSDTPARSDTAKTRATPAAKNAAADQGVDLAKLKGSGDAGRVMRRDVESAVKSTPSAEPAAKSAQAEPAGSVSQPGPISARAHAGERTEERVRMSKRRATIAKRLVEAQSTAAMLSTFNEVDMTGVMALRERHKQAFKERHGIGLGIASFFVKASIGALRAFPRLNAEIQGDEMVLKHYYDIGMAVGAAEGLVVPVLRDADLMSFAQIEGQIRDLAKRANDGTLSLADLKGGTFTITNGGVFGSLLSTPILNPPQVGILGLHAIQPRPVAIDGKVEIRQMMYVALTYDHRIVDGAEAVQFLVRVKQLVEDPGALLLE
jgi:2-oxoglutarate dehydrogenase E2 component (dihydrolipoamide succinyltransferase)